MKKILSFIFIVVIVIGGIVIFKSLGFNDKQATVPEFAGAWARQLEYDAEFIEFQNDGHFAYYGSEGNGVNDYDLCNSYEYDEANKLLKIKCDEGIGTNTPTNIEVVNYEEDSLTLKFNDEVRTFMTRENYDKMLKDKPN